MTKGPDTVAKLFGLNAISLVPNTNTILSFTRRWTKSYSMDGALCVCVGSLDDA